MPYTVSSNASDCSGYAVVKEGENTPIPGGCHKTKAEAIAHMVAVQAEYESGEDRALILGVEEEEGLNPRQNMMYSAYEAIVDQYGMFNQGIGADGAHYVEVSPFAAEGMVCSNCAFYEGGQRCEIVEGRIAPNAICKLWVISEELLSSEPEEMASEYSTRAEVSLVPPTFMRVSAKRGLALHEEGYSGDGLRPATVADARKMANGEALSIDKWKRIGPWIARHIVDLDAVQGDEITAGLVAMLLWGGGSSKSSANRARDYAERLVARLGEDREQPRDELGQFASSNSGDAGASEGSATERQVSLSEVKLKKDASVKPYADGSGDQAKWEVRDAEGKDIGSVTLVKERNPTYVRGGEGYRRIYYSKPKVRVTNPKYLDPNNRRLYDRARSLQSARPTSNKDQAVKDLVNSHNQIVAINAES